jgi:hypothetical protein
MKPRALDLFSGTHSVGKVAQELGYDALSLDLANADICCDILDWEYTEYPPGYFDIIWASPCCRYFSQVRRCNIGRNGYTHASIEDDIITKAVPLLRKTEEIIRYFKPRLWFIENPSTSRIKDFIDPSVNTYTVDYCRYSEYGYKKRTTIFTNKSDSVFTPKLCNRSCGYIIDGKHMINVAGAAKGRRSVGGGKAKDMRYRIPAQLIQELLSQPSVNADLQLHKDNQ